MGKLRLCLILFLFPLLSEAKYIIGGEIYYDDLGGGNYTVTLKVYRDCFNGSNDPFDNPAVITVYDANGIFIRTIKIPFTSSTNVPSNINSPCFTTPANVCVDFALYQTNINLPPKTGGYYLVYQRCCRNSTVLNVSNPTGTGASYVEHIPGPEVVPTNSCPRFNSYPPLFNCAGIDFNFNNSATDPDGDSLVYSLCNPFTGLDACCPAVFYQASANAAPGCVNPPSSGMCDSVAAPPPYAPISFLTPYSGSYPLSSNPAIQINSQTGHISGTPNITGQWVVGVCVSEYRHGVLLGTHMRDFQFNVVNCQNLLVSAIQQQSQMCDGLTVQFNNLSSGASTFLWNFGDATTTADTSTLKNPAYTYPDTGKYTITLVVYGANPLCNDTSTQTFFVYPVLNPSFVSPAPQCVTGNSFNFSAGGQFAPYSNFSWNFSNWATPPSSLQQNPNGITYNQAGHFPVSLTVTEKNCIKTYLDTVIVYPKTQAFFQLNGTIGCQPLPVNFHDGSTYGTGQQFLWNFGDGITSTQENPTHVYQDTGTFNVTLTVVTTSGCVGTSSVSVNGAIVVIPGPRAGFEVNPTHTDIYHNIITFTDTSKNITQQVITLGDGTTLNQIPPTHEYEGSGVFNVVQIAISSNGCSDTAIRTIIIDPDYTFYVPNSFSPNGDGKNDEFKCVSLGIYDFSIVIFDRWGNKLFESNDQEQGWDGKFQGKKCKEDMYVYSIQFTDIVNQYPHYLHGYISLIK